jgi:hypothetical protein
MLYLLSIELQCSTGSGKIKLVLLSQCAYIITNIVVAGVGFILLQTNQNILNGNG